MREWGTVMDQALPELFKLSCDGMMLINQQRRILAMNPAMEKLTGYRARDCVGRSWCGLLLHCEVASGCSLWAKPEECPGLRAMNGLEPVPSAEYKLRRADGTELVVNASYTPIRERPGMPVHALVVMRDITEKKRMEDILVLRTMTDPLTGLPNRSALAEACFQEIQRASRHARPLVVAMADVDDFKSYNGAHGHLAGDELLRGLATLLKTASRAGDFVARYGGDEFALILPESGLAEAGAVLERIRAVVAKFAFFRGNPSAGEDARVSISFGMAAYPGDGTTPETLLGKADERLFRAKAQGGNRVVGPP